MGDFKTPPPFVRCDECGGEEYILDDCNGNADLGELPIDTKCPKCKNSPLPGWIPQYYTPEQYRDWICRENDMQDYELPDDTPIYATPNPEKYPWEKSELCVFKGAIDRLQYTILIRSEAGRPPENYRSV